MQLLVFYLFIALGFSFLCSLLESVLLSITPGFLGVYEKRRPTTGLLLRTLKMDIDRPLGAILTLNTIAHTIGAAGVGAQSLRVFGSGYVAITSAVLTLLILIFTEIIPKTFGAIYFREMAAFTARSLQIMIVLLYPLIFMSMYLTRLISGGKKRTMISRDELQAIADVGYREGQLHEQESRIIKNLFLLQKLRAKDIMTPRTVLFMLPATMTVEEAVKIEDAHFSRIPIHGNITDNVIGFVMKSDIYLEVARDKHTTPLISLRRELPRVSETDELIHLFERFLTQRQQAMLVVDEHGAVAGIVTMEDIIETLLGMEIVDEMDRVVDMRALARQQWLKRARALGIVIDEEDSLKS